MADQIAPRLEIDPHADPPNIAATDRVIDRIVYRLYGLTEKEIQIVEERTR